MLFYFPICYFEERDPHFRGQTLTIWQFAHVFFLLFFSVGSVADDDDNSSLPSF